MAYKEPKPFAQVGDTIIVNSGQEVEFQEREIDGKPNPRFVVYRNASSRVYLKNGTPIRVLIEVGGVVDTDHPLATGKAVCGPLEQQPFFNRFRAEEPTKNIPTEPEEID